MYLAQRGANGEEAHNGGELANPELRIVCNAFQALLTRFVCLDSSEHRVRMEVKQYVPLSRHDNGCWSWWGD